jgi:signal transduction histidine kinase
VRALLGLALLAIVAAVGTLAVLGYLSLRQWEASAELLFREQAREMATMAAEKVAMLLAQADDEALDRIALLLADRALAPAGLNDLLRAAPLLREILLVDRSGRLLYPAAGTAPGTAAVEALRAEMPDAFWERGGRRHVIVGDQLFVIAVVKTFRGEPCLVAISRDPEALRRRVLEPALGAVEGTTVVAVLDHRGRRVYSRDTVLPGDPIVAVDVGQSLPAWRLALYRVPGTTPRDAVRRQVTIFTAAFALLLAVVAAGLVATYRLVRRETEMARLKADFVANVSHDLKTPLSLIRMFGETLEMGRVANDTKRREYYGIITRECERLSRLIDNVLDFSRIEGGRRRYEPRLTAVDPLVRETLDAFAYPMREQGFGLDVRIAPDLPDVPLDAEAVSQALGNLVDNAIKYSETRKALRVEAAVRNGYLTLAVEDEGIGIPLEEQTRIFEKFYRVGRSDTQGRRGSGVGLALVRHVAEAHGGRVTVESRPGAGSRFTLWFPLAGRPAR